MEKEYIYVYDGMSKTAKFFKRTLDILVSIFCIIVFSPVFLCCFILVRLEDGGPAIYKQERIGRYGKPFFIYKFRSMMMDSEKNGPQLFVECDSRLTKVGKFLRDHHLDELPQLWNVLVGDMSFIGPRPERKYFIDLIMQHDRRYECLYQIRPGVTSYATLHNGYTDTLEKMLTRLKYDLYYLEHRSFWFDTKVLFTTFVRIVIGDKF